MQDQATQSPNEKVAAAPEHGVRKTVDHNYTDYSHVSDGEILDVLKHELPSDTDLIVHTDRDAEHADRETVALKRAFGSTNSQEEMLDELRRQPNMNLTEKLRILCECLRRNTGGIAKPFPLKLMEMLANKDTQNILSWMPHGRAFKIFHQSQFVSVVLPLFFCNNIKYTSFNRQLNLWGFKRLTKGQDNGSYYHELFLRGKPLLAMRMKRQRIKGTGVKLSSDPSREPNFYSADFPQLPECDLSALSSTSLGDVQEDWCSPSNEDSATSNQKVHAEGLNERYKNEKPPSKSNLTTSRSNLKKGSSSASSPKITEDSPDDVSDIQVIKKKSKRSKDGSAFITELPQMPFLRNADDARAEVAVGQSISESSSGAACYGSAGMQNFSGNPYLASRDLLLQNEITEVEFILRKQRQELELLTALTELKKQEYDIMVRMCQAGSNLQMAGRNALPRFPFASEENLAMGPSLALLQDQLASVRSMQRRPSSSLLFAADDSQRGLYSPPSANGAQLLQNEQSFPSQTEPPVSPGGAMAARRLSLIRSNQVDNDGVSSISLENGRPADTAENETDDRHRRAGL